MLTKDEVKILKEFIEWESLPFADNEKFMCSPEELIKKFEKTTSDVRVGDEFIYMVNNERKVLIAHDRSLGEYTLLDSHANSCYANNLKYYKPTGRHFSQITEILNLLKEEND